ncbi:MAG: hypothetical protein II453_04400 [Alphaproteobacteria bacterium]|nr:hypothetical protein [Alphaproteobacteria bacterium]
MRIQPAATVEFSEGIDGRDSKYYISYHCPICNHYIKEKQQACEKCCVFLIGVKKQKSKLQDLLFGFNLFKVIL